MSAFGLPPSPPPGADVLYVWPLRDGSTRERCVIDLVIQGQGVDVLGILRVSAIRDKMAAKDPRQPPGQA